jgi:hypothetical protein
MTLSELQDWHRRRVGWTPVRTSYTFRQMTQGVAHLLNPDPFPADLNGARASLPEGVVPVYVAHVNRYIAVRYESAANPVILDAEMEGPEVYSFDSMIRDWYALSKMVWEVRDVTP